MEQIKRYLYRKHIMCLTPQEEQMLLYCSGLLMGVTYLSTMDRYIQHGNTSCLMHSIAVAYYSLLFARLFHLKCRTKSLMIGSLLHDYFLYDWHEANHSGHGFSHPNTAYQNARRDVALNSIEADIIKRHMFPLTPIHPRYRESYIVCLVDKLCSIYEVFKKSPYRFLRKKYVTNRRIKAIGV